LELNDDKSTGLYEDKLSWFPGAAQPRPALPPPPFLVVGRPGAPRPSRRPPTPRGLLLPPPFSPSCLGPEPRRARPADAGDGFGGRRCMWGPPVSPHSRLRFNSLPPTTHISLSLLSTTLSPPEIAALAPRRRPSLRRHEPVVSSPHLPFSVPYAPPPSSSPSPPSLPRSQPPRGAAARRARPGFGPYLPGAASASPPRAAARSARSAFPSPRVRPVRGSARPRRARLGLRVFPRARVSPPGAAYSRGSPVAARVACSRWRPARPRRALFPHAAARSLLATRRSPAWRARCSWRGVAPCPRRTVPWPRRGIPAWLSPPAASARTPLRGALSPTPVLARRGPAQRGPGSARLWLARSWCPCVARRVRSSALTCVWLVRGAHSATRFLHSGARG
jgi:hypothetical protein